MTFSLSKCLKNFKLCQLRSIRFYCLEETSRYERDEAGPKKKIIHGQEYPQWKRPIVETPGAFTSKFSAFESDKPFNAKLLIVLQYPVSTWPSRTKRWMDRTREEFEIKEQNFNKERLKILGPDLAVAHFVCFRGGAVKFVSDNNWIKMDEKKNVDLPNTFNPGYFVEMIDCENFYMSGLRYEGLLNFTGLNHLKWISLKNNKLIDDWSLDRLSHMVANSLEYLDLRGCPVTHRGIQVLHRTVNLRLLILDSKVNDEDLEMTCAMLQEIRPDLLIKFD